MTHTNSTETSETRHLAAGRWVTGSSGRWDDVFNPSTGRRIARVPLSSSHETEQTVVAAAEAAEGWSELPVVDRARVMFRYRELLEAHFDELAMLVTREHGKTLAESRAEVRRGIEAVEFACGIPSLLMGETITNIVSHIDAEATRYPVGICVGITPYNFPIMVPLWMFPIALVCGNVFVLKPSEKVPLSAVRIGELLVEAGCPSGVFSIVHGDRECVECLLTHPLVDAVSFVGSTPIARHVYQTATRHGKRVQAAGGAKNHLIVLPDADLQECVRALSVSAFGCAGQRCMAGSVAVAVGACGDRLVDELSTYAGRLRVGPTHEGDDVDMGPLIRSEHVERVAGYLDIARDEGATIALDGRRPFDGNGYFLGPSVVDRVHPEMRLAREEIFGPLLSVIRAPDLETALEIEGRCEYGNGASIFTRDGYAAREFRRRSQAGMIGVNVAVPAPMAWFPFTGWNNSFFGDLHMQGTEALQFYTKRKVTLTRWTDPDGAAQADGLWKGDRRPQ